MTDYDAVVVGGGPAGLWFAKRAAERGLKVLVLERKKEIGTPVQCAEGFGLNGLKRLGIEPDPKWNGWKVSGAKVYAPNGKYVRIPGEGFVIERKIFEKELAKMATRAGARVLAFHEVTDVIKESGEIVGVRARFLGDEKEFY
ncbi:TPA: NAD(P)/FAD-dependent oxidoreductase, partial [Candidatus Micrarchaeota archaeon]|nr:NAD(P)/FAD-dependent oxidoreductase [Candidatus Micrarchaeota archaeon]